MSCNPPHTLLLCVRMVIVTFEYWKYSILRDEEVP